MWTLIPLGDRVLVELTTEWIGTRRTEHIIIPDTHVQRGHVMGKVVTVGPEAMDVRESDMVILPSWGGTSIQVDERKLTLVRERDIIAVVYS